MSTSVGQSGGRRTRRSRRGRHAAAFAPPATTSAGPTLATRIGLGFSPLLLFIGHLLYGAEHALAAQWYVVTAATVALVTLALPPVGRKLARIRLWAPAVLLTFVLLIAGLSLTSLGPQAPHRLWSFVAEPGHGVGTLNITNTLFEMSKLAGLGCLFLLGCAHGGRRAWGRATMEALLAVGTLYAAISIGMFVSGSQIMEGGRLSGGFLSANSGALVFGVLTLLALSAGLRFWQENRWTRCLISTGQAALFAVCLVMTASRMGMAATVAAGLILMLWEFGVRRDLGGALILSGLAFAIGVSAVLIGGNDLLWRRADDYAGDLLVRTVIFHEHWQAFLKAPLTGYGLGSFTEVNNMIMTPGNYGSLEPIRAAHNVYIQWLEEAGIVGALPMFALISWILFRIVRNANGRRPEASILRGVFAASLVVLTLGATDFGLQIISIAGFWAFLLGLAFALAQTGREKSSNAVDAY